MSQPDDKLPDDKLIETARILEALIFASAKPVSRREMMVYAAEESELDAALQLIADRYGPESGLEFCRIDRDWAFRTRPEVAARLNLEKPVERPLSRAALEVLAIIAYHQPVTRAEIEEIRGISLSRGTLDILLELGWIKPRGRRRTPGRPLTWGTSPAFLDYFGLSGIDDLPGMEDLRASGLLRKGQILGGLGEPGEAAEPDDETDLPSDEEAWLDFEAEAEEETGEGGRDAGL